MGARPSSSGAPRQWKVMIGPLSSMRTRSARSSGVSRSATNGCTCLASSRSPDATRGVVVLGSSSSAPCEPAYVDAAHADEPPDVGRRAARDARHAAVAARQPRQQQRGLLGHVRVLGALHDRRERAVDVEEERRARGVVCEWA